MIASSAECHLYFEHEVSFYVCFMDVCAAADSMTTMISTVGQLARFTVFSRYLVKMDRPVESSENRHA